MIKWGMIGAGDVTEVKSGPAFKKVDGSDLVAVMRRDEAKVVDYATRHGIARWYTDIDSLLQDEELNAVYIATPPHVHLEYAIKALKADKMVYLEKPMTLNHLEGLELLRAVEQYDGKLVVAHYRRSMPYFQQVVNLIKSNRIGDVSAVNLLLSKKPLISEESMLSKNQWRVDPSISGGGLFHDLAPHQIDLMLSVFGEVTNYSGISTSSNHIVADKVTGYIAFQNGVIFNGSWLFDERDERDECTILGTKGVIRFSFFNQTPIVLETESGNEVFEFPSLQHVQQPMIEQVVAYFQGKASNPCTVQEGLRCMDIMDAFTRA